MSTYSVPNIACDVNTELKSKASGFKKFLVYWGTGNHNKIFIILCQKCAWTMIKEHGMSPNTGTVSEVTWEREILSWISTMIDFLKRWKNGPTRGTCLSKICEQRTTWSLQGTIRSLVWCDPDFGGEAGNYDEDKEWGSVKGCEFWDVSSQTRS